MLTAVTVMFISALVLPKCRCVWEPSSTDVLALVFTYLPLICLSKEGPEQKAEAEAGRQLLAKTIKLLRSDTVTKRKIMIICHDLPPLCPLLTKHREKGFLPTRNM